MLALAAPVGMIAMLSSPAVADATSARTQLELLEITDEESLPYDRQRDFGGWSTAGGDPACLDVRGQVLATQSLSSAFTTLPTGSLCHVTVGFWIDPYTGASFFEATKMDIDHVVPLKEAWQSGAAHWTKAARRAYANDVTDPGHLLAVSAAANRSKGDRDPAQWLPPDPTFKCRYLEIWIGVKSTWHLAADQAEFEALLSGLQGCP